MPPMPYVSWLTYSNKQWRTAEPKNITALYMEGMLRVPIELKNGFSVKNMDNHGTVTKMQESPRWERKKDTLPKIT